MVVMMVVTMWSSRCESVRCADYARLVVVLCGVKTEQ